MGVERRESLIVPRLEVVFDSVGIGSDSIPGGYSGCEVYISNAETAELHINATNSWRHQGHRFLKKR